MKAAITYTEGISLPSTPRVNNVKLLESNNIAIILKKSARRIKDVLLGGTLSFMLATASILYSHLSRLLEHEMSLTSRIVLAIVCFVTLINMLRCIFVKGKGIRAAWNELISEGE